MPLHPNTHQCTHVKADGLRCGSPALRGQSFCYFHHHSPDHRPRTQARVVQIPFPENAAAIQVAIHNVMLAIIDRRIEERRASQLLWALQIAAGQGRQLPFNNSILMSRTVTELPDYELEELKEKEEERRILAEVRTNEEQRKRATAEPHTTDVESRMTDGSITRSPDAPNSSDPQISPVIPSGAAPRGEVEGPAFPAHQQSAAGKPKPRSRNSKPATRNSTSDRSTVRSSDPDGPISASDLDSALAGNWRAVDRLFRSAGLMAPQTAT